MMVVETVFSDRVVNASDLRKNQKRWLEEALKRPVTVNYSRKQLAIMNRDQVRDLFIKVQFAELALAACQNSDNGSILEKLPWLEHLSSEHKTQFRDELVNTFLKLSKTGKWDELEDLISDWKATAETEGDPEIVKALKDAETAKGYVSLD